MKNKSQNKAKYFVVLVIALAVIFLSSRVWAEDKPTIKKGEILDNQLNTKEVAGEYLSPIFNTDFAFNVFGLQLPYEVSDLHVRYYSAQGWSDWIEPEILPAKDGSLFTEPILASAGEKIQYKFTASQSSAVKIIYLTEDSQKDNGLPNILQWLFAKASAEGVLNIISRPIWQADETWRLNASGAEVWPAEYKYPEKFVIHHTAGSDGGTDPAGTVRGVYYWHAVVLGWGDIGYNYLIDQQGNIYEGRYGGDGVIGAHVYRSKTCAASRFGGEQYEANFNPGTIGISILGDYNTLTLNDAVKNSLTSLIAQKAKDFEIVPDGQSYFIDNTYPNIAGHQDMDCTECPGTNLYSQLTVIRQETQAKYAQLGGVTEPLVKATFVSQSEQPVVINAGETKEVWVDFKNEGNVTWRNYKQDTLKVLALASPSSFYVAGWSSATEVAKLATANVAPGEVGRFIFTVKAPSDRLELSEIFNLSFGSTSLEGTGFTIKAEIYGLPYAALLDSRTISPATFTKATQVVTIKLRNRGTETWQKSKVKLNIYDLNDEVSRYYDSSWPNQYGQIEFRESEVKQNELATFTFKMKSPATTGMYLNIFRLKGEQEIINNESTAITRVDSPYQAQIAYSNIPLAMLNVWRLPAVIKFKNTGITTWNQSMVLKAYDLGNKVSQFKDKAWIDNFTVVKMAEREVKPGQIGTFKFYFKAPKNIGTYVNNFIMNVNGKDVVVQGGSLSLITRVDK